MDDARVAALYGEALESFVAARDALAADLKRSGDAAGAKAVRALRKPSVPAWGINRVARAHPRTIARLIEAGEVLHAAQRDVLAGGDRDRLRAATAAERAIVEELTDAVERVFAEAGFAATADRRERVAETFYAVAADDDAREAVRSGTLTKELQRVGFGEVDPALLTAAVAPSAGRERHEGRPAGAEAHARAARARAASAEAEAARLERAADEADAAAAVARLAAKDARARAVEVAREADEAEAALAEG